MDIPTQSGYYWRRGLNQDITVVDQVVLVEPMISTAPTELFYWEAGELGGIYVKPEPDTYWSGPIRNPFTPLETP